MKKLIAVVALCLLVTTAFSAEKVKSCTPKLKAKCEKAQTKGGKHWTKMEKKCEICAAAPAAEAPVTK